MKPHAAGNHHRPQRRWHTARYFKRIEYGMKRIAIVVALCAALVDRGVGATGEALPPTPPTTKPAEKPKAPEKNPRNSKASPAREPAAPTVEFKFDKPMAVPQVTATALHSEVSAALDKDGRLHVVWIEEDKKARELYHAVLDSATNQFDKPTKVRDTRGELQRGIQVRADEGAVYVVWCETPQAPTDTEIRLAVSRDGGGNWDKSVRVSDNPKQKPASLPALAVSQGRVFVTWLDARNSQPGRGTDLYLASSPNGGRDFNKPGALVPQANESAQCIAATKQLVLVLGRLGQGPAQNDVVLRASADGGNTFPGVMRVAIDGWKQNRPLDSGPQAVFDDRDRLHVVWMCGKENAGDVYYTHSFMKDGFTQFELKKRVHLTAQGTQTLPVLALDGERIVVAWQDARDRQTSLALTQSTDDGKTFAVPVLVPLANNTAVQAFGSLPSLCVAADGATYLAWIESIVTLKQQRAHVVRVPRPAAPAPTTPTPTTTPPPTDETKQ